MQGLPWKPAQNRQGFTTDNIGHLVGPFWLAVEWISDHAVADMSHMRPDLVGAARFQLAFNQAPERWQIPQGFIMGHSMATEILTAWRLRSIGCRAGRRLCIALLPAAPY